jgi:hypothetical protein
MPRINRRARPRKPRLTEAQELELLIGGTGAFANPAARRQAWLEHHEYLLELLGGGIRPAAADDYDDPKPERKKRNYGQRQQT